MVPALWHIRDSTGQEMNASIVVVLEWRHMDVAELRSARLREVMPVAQSDPIGKREHWAVCDVAGDRFWFRSVVYRIASPNSIMKHSPVTVSPDHSGRGAPHLMRLMGRDRVRDV